MPLPPRPAHSSLELIGNTPVVQLRHVVPDDCAQNFLKLESVNPTGSYKDRMAKSMVEEAEHRGDLKPGITVVEATGGSTGSSLAFVCAVKGYQFHVVSSNAFAVEKLRTMEAFGANIDLVQSPSGKITADLIPSMIRRAEDVAEGKNYYFTNQFKNRDALIGFEAIGQELRQQFPERIDAFCGAVGTAGMVMGPREFSKRSGPIRTLLFSSRHLHLQSPRVVLGPIMSGTSAVPPRFTRCVVALVSVPLLN